MNLFAEVYSHIFHIIKFKTQLPVMVAGSFFVSADSIEQANGGCMKKILEKFLGPLYFCLSRVLPLEGINPLNCTLTIKYTFNRYIPDRGRRPQPDEGAPRTSCPQGLSRKARLVAIPNHSEISACYG